MAEKMSNELRVAFTTGRTNAVKYKDSFLRLEHVLFGIMTTPNIIHDILNENIGDFQFLITDIENFNKRQSVNSESIKEDGILPLDPSIHEVLMKCKGVKNKEEYITPELFFTTALDYKIAITKIIKDYGITKTFIQNSLKQSAVTDSYFGMEEDTHTNTNKNMGGNNTNTKSKTPVLDQFSRDLTNMAKQGKIDPVIGREAEVERVAQVLARRKKNNPVLIGDPGVGKTAIVEGLAIKIDKNDCPRPLVGKRLMMLDLTAMVAGTKYRGDLENRMKSILDEVRENPNVILFLDELHTIIGAGNSSGALDAANVFKPALARGELQCIGATTIDEYREYIEKDGALDRRFQKVMVEAPTPEQTLEIVRNIAPKYEEYHKVTYTPEALDEIVRLADRYITTREFPDKAIDILDEAGARTQVNIKPPARIKELEAELIQINKEKEQVVSTQNFEMAGPLRDRGEAVKKELDKEKQAWKELSTTTKTVVTEEMVCEVVSMMTGIPITKISQNEVKKLLSIDKELANTVIGQEDAINKVTRAIKRNRTGIRKKNKPIGSFIFIGSTGIGKTELAKVLTKQVYGNPDENLIRIDMSEFGEKFNISKLIGAPPGYVGYNEGGQLTEKVRNKPYSVVLLDEIEKAHPDVFDILLQVLDDGQLTDGAGRKINFKNTIIIMTTNIGLKKASEFGQGIGYKASEKVAQNTKEIIQKELKKTFKMEFLNRVDDVVYFNQLTKDDIVKIVDLQLKDLATRLAEEQRSFTITDDAKNKLAELGYSEDFGARELNRTIQKYIEDAMSDELLVNGMPQVAKFTIDLVDNEIKVTLIPEAVPCVS